MYSLAITLDTIKVCFRDMPKKAGTALNC